MNGLEIRDGKQQDAFGRVVLALAVLATPAAVVLGPFSEVEGTWAGVSLLILSAAHWLAWSRNRALWCVRAGAGLFALGSLLVIFGELGGAEARLAVGAAVVFALFVFTAVTAERFPKASHATGLTGHLTSIVLACAALVQAWPVSTWYMPMTAGGFVLLYAMMPRLRKNFGFRLGATLWVSFAVLFCLAAHKNTPYWRQMPLAVFLSLVYVALGYAIGFRREKPRTWSTACYACAAVFAGYCGIVSLFTPGAVDAWRLFLVNGIIFACLFLILRHDVFVYLVTLSLSLMAYSWVKISTNVFTQDVLFYLVIGAAMLGAFFSMPHLKRVIVRTGAVPMISIFSRRGKALMAIPIVGFALLVLSAYSLKLTSHPTFCSSCHNMDEYYATWQHSSHQDVACVQCHFEPGPTAMMEGKIAGLIQVVKYVSHSYSTKPHALISNKSCMRPGCHADMDHGKEALLFHGRIKFRHDRHLAELPMGRVLNCVSCHGYTGKGEHISVTKTTCLTCHFYGRAEKPVAAGGCTTCHRLPDKPVTFMGQAFNHQKFLKDKKAVRCEHCHNQVTQGQGGVSDTRCRSCHSDNRQRGDDPSKFHLVHVSEGHFDCLQCHDEIRHGTRPMAQQLLASGNCKTCHSGERHSVQERIYAGTAIPAMKASPDPMYKAGVSCGGCHTDVRTAGLGAMPFTMKLSGTKQCVDCHAKKRYGKMLTDWQDETKERLKEFQAAIAKLDKDSLAAQSPPAAQLAEVKKLLGSARTKLTYIVKDGSYGAHNFPYISSALDTVEEEIDQCKSLVSKWKAPTQGSP